MDFRLRVFQKVAEELSFTKASQILYISQPAVTKHIRELEKQYGKPLFNRHGNSISLTSPGKILLQYALEIIDLYERLENEFLEVDAVLPRNINLAASTTMAQYILPSLLAKFKSYHPATIISLLNQNSEGIENLVVQKKTLLGLTEGTKSNSLLHYEPFIKDEIILATRTDNPVFKSSSINLSELKKLPLAIREKGSGTREIIEKSLLTSGIGLNHLDIEIELGSTESIKNYLLSSETFAFLSIHSIVKELKNQSLSIVDIEGLEITRVFQFVSLHGNYNKTAERLKNFFNEHYNLME